MQYVTTVSLTSGVYTPRYIFGAIDQKILSMSLRVDYNITPDLTIQYWGQPFFASGKYSDSDFKRITDPVADEMSGRYHTFTGNETSYSDGTYMVDENLDGMIDYNFGNPDFTVSEFLHNFVIRWEFLPGSTAFLVWSQNRDYYTGSGMFDVSRQSHDLFHETKPYNIFLIKFSYRFGLH